ncbi:MAG: EAL domain-containing protein [Acidovorax sp.]
MTAATSSHPPFRSWLPGAVVAVAGLLVSAGLVQQQRAVADGLAHARLTEAAHSATEAVAGRMAAYTEMVTSLRDLLVVHPGLTRAEFERVMAAHAQRYPELRSLSFVRWVPARDLPAFEARLRAEAPPGRKNAADLIHPKSERQDYYINEFAWPYEGNEALIGLEISSQPANLAALLAGRDSGRPTVSAPFALIQNQGQRQRMGVVLRMPVFTGSAEAGQPGRYVGAAAASLRVVDMLRALESSGALRSVVARVEDVGAVGGAEPPVLLSSVDAPPGAAGQPQAVHELQVHNRRWRLTFTPQAGLLSEAERQLPWWIGGGAALLSLLLAGLVTALARQRAQALTRAQTSDEALLASEERFRAVFNQAAVGVAQIDTPTGRLVRVNQKYSAIMGYTVDELLRLDFQTLTYPEDLGPDLAQMERLKAGEITEYHMEKRLLRKGGQQIWVDLTVSPMWRPGETPNHHIAVVQDVTERRRMQDQLQDNERRLRSILDRLPLGLYLVRDGSFVYRNARFVEITGYTEADVTTVSEWLEHAYPDADARERAHQGWSAARAKAQAGSGLVAPVERLIRCKNGQARTVELSGMVLDDGMLITVTDLSQRKAAEEEIRYLAFYDPLTQLPNRRLLLDRLHQALAAGVRRRRGGALLMVDVDNFKTLNDTRGHECGDALLRQVAQRLRELMHEDHTVARHGGDKFVVVLEDLAACPEEAAARAEDTGQQILAALRDQPYSLEGEPYHATVSMGATLFQGLDESTDELVKRAELAMYQAKAAGRNSLQFYDPHMQAVVSARAALERDMRTGLAQGQFELFYQPQMEGGAITGAEALLRWRHPVQGFIPPASFVPLAEETGLILPLGEWVLTAACRQLATWAHHPALGALNLAVNVSPRQFHQKGFVPQVLAALAGSGAEAHRLKLEITEGLLLEDVEDTVQKMVQLKGYGVGFSLDDFGTGYSSLSYLKRLPLDQLKIDQSFVRDVLTDPNDAAIARTIVTLGASLGLRVIAEGVETEAQRDFLARSQCQAWQGYLLSPPVPVAEFEALVLRHNGELATN